MNTCRSEKNICRSSSCWQFLAVCAAVLLLAHRSSFFSVRAAEPDVPTLDGWSNLFAGQEVKLPIRFTGRVAEGERVSWSVSVEGRVIARREETLRIDPPNPSQLTVTFQLPEGEPKTVLSASLKVDAGGKEMLTKPLWIFPRDPFVDNPPFAAETELSVFDPNGDTAKHLEAGKLEFRTIQNLDVLAKATPELLVVGEGVNFREYRALPDLLVKAAAAGGHVLCLAPIKGSFVLPEPQPDLSGGLEALSLRKSNVIADFDKRLDYLTWPGEGNVVRSTVTIGGKGKSLNADVVEGDGKWPWLEAEFPGGGRLIVCGFALIERWDDGPAPRHILRHVLAHAARKPQPPVVSAGDRP
ncbi:MAG: hypothetical protein ACKVT0_13200 [Planctomycetaceae bacterium]